MTVTILTLSPEELIAYQYGYVEKIIDFDSVTDPTKEDTRMEIDTIIENLKTVSIDDGKRKYKKYTPEQAGLFIQIMQRRRHCCTCH